MRLTILALFVAAGGLLVQCSAFVVSPVLRGSHHRPTRCLAGRQQHQHQQPRRVGYILGMSVEPLDDDTMLAMRENLANSPQLGELMLTLRGRGYAVEMESGDVLEPGDDEPEEESVPSQDELAVQEDLRTQEEESEGDGDAVEDAPPQDAEPATATLPEEPEEPAVEVKEVQVEEVVKEEEAAAVVVQEKEESIILGVGGMADTRDPEELDHDDPRKSISAAPTFEEYLKARAKPQEVKEEVEAEKEEIVRGVGGMADTRDPEELDHEDPRKSISAAPTFEEYLKARAAA